MLVISTLLKFSELCLMFLFSSLHFKDVSLRIRSIGGVGVVLIAPALENLLHIPLFLCSIFVNYMKLEYLIMSHIKDP